MEDLVKPAEPAKSAHVTEHLANERTYLAWIRTALGLIGFGFVLARVGLFLHQLTLTGPTQPAKAFHLHTGHEFIILGVVFLIVGTLVCAWSAWSYGQKRVSIDRGIYFPAQRSIVVLSGLIVVTGLIIAVLVVWRLLVAPD